GLPVCHALEMGLLLQEMTMAGLHELRFTEEKPLLRGQDTELVSLVATLALAPAREVPGCGCVSGSSGRGVCWYWVFMGARGWCPVHTCVQTCAVWPRTHR
uniref:Uncharacterized protein n=1 Tax=Strix occidentalis caurina TaxID=311401 RepID=A0A8D0F257_STROC